MAEQTPMDLMKCCPIDNTFKIIGKKFTVHIIRNMAMQGQSRFNQMLDSIEDSNPKTLSARLKEMEKSECYPAVRNMKLHIYSRLPASSTEVMSTGHVHWVFKYWNTAHTNITLKMKKKNDFNKVILLTENIPLFISSWQKMPVII